MTRKIMHNARTGTTVEVDFTAAEETQRTVDLEATNARKQAEADAVVAQEATDAQTSTDKASARVKLMGVEYTPLTEAEADAVTI